MKIGSRFSHYFFAISVILVSGGVLGQVVLNSHAQDLTANVGNSAPIIVGGSEKLCDNSGSIANTDGAISACSNLAAVTLSAGTTTDLSFFARARDNNGNSDISSGPFTGAFYHDANSDTGNAGCTDDDNDCYQLSCSKVVDIPGGGDTDAWIRCDFSMQYFADDSVGAAEWLGYVEIYDQALVGANNGSGYATEVSKLISATFPVVNFGNRQLGAETDAGSNVEIQHQNNGNVLIDFEVSADDDDTNAALDCTTTGNLSVSNIKFDTSDVDYSTSLFTLPAEPTTVELNIDIQQRTNDSTTVIDDATGDIQRTYWNVSVPATGLEGFCEEELNVTVLKVRNCMDKERDYIHFAYGAILLAVGLIVIAVVFLFRSEAQDITLDITNVAPTISNVKMCLGSTASDNASISGCSSISNVNLTANSTTDLSLFFQASDSNGVDDLGSTATGVYYLSTTTSGCTADNNDCYRDDATCQKITPTIDGTDAWYRCDMAVEYYALHSVGAPVWNAYVGVLDQGSLLTTSDAYLNEITYLVAGTFPTVDFGSLALGYTSTAGDNIQTAHQNLGNTVADIRVSMSNTDTNEEIDCDLGGIPDSNVKFDYDDLNGDVGYASAGVTLESQGVGYSDLNLDLAVRTNDSSPEGPNNPAQAGDDIEYIYWNITVPTSGVGGTCTEELIATYLQG